MTEHERFRAQLQADGVTIEEARAMIRMGFEFITVGAAAVWALYTDPAQKPAQQPKRRIGKSG